MKESDNEYILEPNIKSAMFGNLLGMGLVGLIIGTAIGIFMNNLVLGAVIFVVFTAATNVIGYFNLKATEYRFESKQLEYREGFINIRQSNVSYDRITDLSLRQPITQRIFNTGTILVNTAGSDGRELSIAYIDSSEEEFESIKEITKQV